MPDRRHLALLLLLLGVAVACSKSGPSAGHDAGPEPSAAATAQPTASATVGSPPVNPAPVKPPPPAWKRLADTWIFPNPIPNFALVDHTGRRFRLRELAQGHVFVGFIFTHCSIPSACPRTTSQMHALGKRWKQLEDAGDTKGQSLRLLTLTFDPEEDTPPVLASYSETVRKDVPNWLFATGETELMEKALPRMFGVRAKPDGKGTIAHDVKAALLRPGLRIAKQWTDNSFKTKEVINLVRGGH